MSEAPISVSTPGRICLFGEHQDYLGLPVIAAAISRRVSITGATQVAKEVNIQLPDIQSSERFDLNFPLAYTRERDYYKSALNVVQREGLTFVGGIVGEVHGNIPINSGTSSSSALLASWITLLSLLSEQKPTWPAQFIAELANRAEVLEFGEPGGMMDHYSTAMGNVIYLESVPCIKVETLKPDLGTFVLGDSLEPKDTIGILGRVKFGMLDIIHKIKSIRPDFTLASASDEDLSIAKKVVTEDEWLLLIGNISDRDILREAKLELSKPHINHQLLGDLLNQHFANLRDAKKISTPKLNKMVDVSLQAGALGAKTNGSGGGGCMFAYAPSNAENVAEAIEKVGGKAYIISIDEGTKVLF